MTQKNKVTRVARIEVTVERDWLYGPVCLTCVVSRYFSGLCVLKGRVSGSFIEWEPDEDPAEEVSRIPAVQTDENW
jgi:hypothetical protein